jgi:hypothetical protein
MYPRVAVIGQGGVAGRAQMTLFGNMAEAAYDPAVVS